MMIDAFKDIVIPLINEGRAVPVNFVWGDSSYIRDYLIKMKTSSSTAPYRFPLVGLYSPFSEIRDSEDYRCKATLNFILAVNTLPGYSNEQRHEISFKSVLRPLYADFMKALKDSRLFEAGYDESLPHSYTENYSFGVRGALDVDGKEMDEKIDAIEIKNLELILKNLNCYANRL